MGGSERTLLGPSYFLLRLRLCELGATTASQPSVACQNGVAYTYTFYLSYCAAMPSRGLKLVDLSTNRIYPIHSHQQDGWFKYFS